MTPFVAALWFVALLMATATAFLVRWASHARSAFAAGAALFLLAMMAAMFGGAVLYFAHPSAASLVEGLWVASLAMSLSVVPLFLLFARDARARLAGGPPPSLARTAPYFALAIALVLGNELLMGWAFLLASGSLPAMAGGIAGAVALFENIVTSSWFLFTMALEMGLTTFLLRERLPRIAVVVLLLQAAIMVLSPTALPDATWRAASIYLGSALMIGLVVLLMEYLYRHRELNAHLARYLPRLLGAYGAMMAGLFLWVQYGSVDLFALSIVAEMVVYFEAVLGPERYTAEDRFAWQLRANWAFALMLTVFVAELFMGALLDVQAEPSVYGAAVPSAAIAGPPLAALTNAVANGFWFVSLVTGSTWFLLMMGVEMGALVALKLRESKNLENRIRLGLTIASYGGFAVFFPSVYFATVFPNAPSGPTVPFLGWSMGIGSAALAPEVFSAVLVTYLITGLLTVLFGRRAICSVFCTAPLMYQGTTIDAMKSFNHSSPLGRKFLSSRLSTAYGTTTSVVLASLVVASSVSYLDQIGRLNVLIDGVDPTVFLFSLYFGILWYAMFVAIPYAGNYNCVTMGWCYTGTIAQAFQKVGFFKLKVRDRSVCWACTTLDCAKGCPVGLTDMPGHFRQKGEFRSSKCCGVGDCVEACPYGNLYIADVRHWIAARLHRPLPPMRPIGVRVQTVAPARAAPAGARASSSSGAAAAVPGGRAEAAPSPSL